MTVLTLQEVIAESLLRQNAAVHQTGMPASSQYRAQLGRPPGERASEHRDTQREREAEAAIDGRSGLNGSMNGRQGEAAAARPSRGAPPGFS